MKYFEAVYLWHVGKEIGVKVSIYRIQPDVFVCIRDAELHSFEKALEYLRHITQTEIVDDVDGEVIK